MNSIRKPAFLFFLAAIFLFGNTVMAAPVGKREIIRQLEKSLRDSNMLNRHSAADKLSRIGGEEARKVFEKMARRDGVENKRVGLVGLARVAPEKSVDLFAANLECPQWEARWAAVYGLGRTGDAAWLSRLAQIAKEDPGYLAQQKRYPVREQAEASIQRINESPKWLLSLDEAKALAQKEKKGILVFWFIPAAPYTQKMLDESFFNPGYASLKKAFVWVKIDAEENVEWANHYEVKDVPSLLLLTSDGKEQERLTGFYDAETLAREWNWILKGGMTTFQLAEKVRQNPADFAAVAELARRYVRNNQAKLAVPLWEKIQQGKGMVSEQDREEALFALGHFYGSSGDHSAAVKYLQLFCEEFSHSKELPKAQFCLALSMLASGKESSGEKLLRELADQKLDPNLTAAVKNSLKEIKERKFKRGGR